MVEKKVSVPTQSQLAATEVSVYLQSMNIIHTEAKKHARKVHGFRGRRAFRKETQNQFLQLFRTQSSEQAEPVDQHTAQPTHTEVVFERIKPQLTQLAVDAHEKASDLSKLGRSKIAARAIVHVSRLPSEQREEVLEIAGFTKEEAKTTGKKIGLSTILGATTGTAAFLFVNSMAAYEKLHPLIQQITDWKMAISYAAFYGSTALAAITNKQLLDEPRIKTSANAFPTTAYYLLPKFFSKEKKKEAERWGVGAGTFLPNIYGELTTWGVISSFAGLQGVMGRNIGSTIAELATVVGNLVWLQFQKRKSSAKK